MENTERQDEEKYLAGTVHFIDSEIRRMKEPHELVGQKALTKALQEFTATRLERYTEARPRPYFGRVDFRQANGETITGYIGIHQIEEHVYSWTAPFSRQLFYAEPTRANGYDAPVGKVHGKITLKRQYAIENARLLEVTELYRVPLATGEETIPDTTQSFMIRQLSKRRTGELSQAVATIAPEQYQQIAAASADVMIVQGVAGSGKSIVGLHRIAYLLSPFNERAERMNESRVIFFGPTKTFLTYVSGLLPSLDVRSVKQTTVRDWVTSLLSEKVRADDSDPLLEKLLRKSSSIFASYEAARIKGSVEFSRLLERYAGQRYKGFLTAATAIAVHARSATPIILGADETRRMLKSVRPAPLNEQRKMAIARVVDSFWQSFTDRIGLVSSPGETAYRQFVQEVQPQVTQQVSVFWPHLDFRKEYRDLLSSPKYLAEASGRRIDDVKARKLAASLPRGRTVFDAEDLPGLCYLDHLLNEHAHFGFEHVVIDEAQEVSPLELLLIQRHTRKDSGFTILGDLTQSLSPQGIDGWRKFLHLFRGASVSRYLVRTSYRATYEITKYANTLLKEAVSHGSTALPYARHGQKPSFSASKNFGEMVDAIIRDLAELQALDMGTVGILCRSAFEARKLHRALVEKGQRGAGLLDRDKSVSGQITVAPIDLTRGLEYDAVILAGVNDVNFPATALHSRLLYVGVTRAAHQLRIHWFGKPAAQLRVPRKPARSPGASKTKRPRPGHRDRNEEPGSTLPRYIPSRSGGLEPSSVPPQVRPNLYSKLEIIWRGGQPYRKVEGRADTTRGPLGYEELDAEAQAITERQKR